jgi:multiple sugar transport system substrate-binding protein
MTGGEVELQQFAFGEMFEKMITSFETGAIDYDVLIFPADWAGDFMAPGYLEPVPGNPGRDSPGRHHSALRGPDYGLG